VCYLFTLSFLVPHFSCTEATAERLSRQGVLEYLLKLGHSSSDPAVIAAVASAAANFALLRASLAIDGTAALMLSQPLVVLC
jgi:hypothetical protein